MNIHHATRTHLLRGCAALGVVAVAMVGFTGTAAAAVPTHQATPSVRVGFADSDSITDLVPYNLQLTNADQGGGWSNGEYPSQTEVYSGYGSTWEITNWVESNLWSYYNQPWNVQYQFTDNTGATDTVTMSLAQQSPAGTAGTCSISGATAGNYTCGTTGTNEFYVAASNPQNLSQADRNQFAQGLSNLCNGPHSANGRASCTFTPAPDSFRYFVDPTGYAGKSWTEPGCFPWATDGQPNTADSNTYTEGGSSSVTDSFSDSLTTSVEAGVDGVAMVGVSNSTSWGHEFTHGVSYSNTVPVTARYGYLATAQLHPLDAAITGNFTATLGGATYTLNDVTLTSSFVTGAVVNGNSYGRAISDTQQIPMNQAMWDANCSGDVPPAHLPA